jgi:hypothetical protein
MTVPSAQVDFPRYKGAVSHPYGILWSSEEPKKIENA